MDLATRTAWQAVGLGFVDAGSAADLTGIAIDSREYFCSVVDVTLGFVEGIVEPGDGTADYFTRVQVSGTVVSVVPATDINETIGPAF